MMQKWIISLAPVALVLLTACAAQPIVNKTFLDVEKACGERQKLVEKLMNLKQSDFLIPKVKTRQWTPYENWDLKKNIAQSYGWQWLQLRWKYKKLQAVWFGPRHSLDEDLFSVGLTREDLRQANGSKVNDFDTGIYYAKNLEGQQMQIEHEGSLQKGMTITCFPEKKK